MTKEVKEELAVIEGIAFGLRDCGHPVIWFGVKCMTGGALQVIGMKEIPAFLEEWSCYNLRELEGKTCVVAIDDNEGTVRYRRAFK